MNVGLRLAAAVLSPLALLAAGCSQSTVYTDFAPQAPGTASAEPTGTPSAQPANAGGVDYLVGGVWHRSDGSTVALPKDDYYAAVMWNDRLVATRSDGEVFSTADVVGPDGKVVESLQTTSGPVANDDGTTLAWVQTDGKVMTAWSGGRVQIGDVDLAAAGESIAYSAAAVTGGPSCLEADGGGCIVYLNSGEGKPRTFDSHGVNDNPLPQVVTFKDVSEQGPTTYVDKVSDDGSCGGLADVKAQNPAPKWTTCAYQPAQISPNGSHVIGLPAYFDGLGISRIAVLDAATGKERTAYGPEEGFIADWAWSAAGAVVFDVYENGTWRLQTIAPDGLLVDVGEPAKGEDVDSPFTLIEH